MSSATGVLTIRDRSAIMLVTDCTFCDAETAFKDGSKEKHKGVFYVMDMIIVAILIGFFQACTFVGFALVIRSWAARKQAVIEDRVTRELGKLVAGEPCQSASVLLAVGKCVGQEAGRSAKMAILGELSSAQRNINGIARDAAIADVSEAQPGLGAVLAAMGKNKAKGLLANPLVQLALQGFMSKNGNDGKNGNDAGGRDTGSEYTGRRHR